MARARSLRPDGTPRRDRRNDPLGPCEACGEDPPVPRRTRGLCPRCYKRWQRHGDPSLTLPRGNPWHAACLNCAAPAVGGGHCADHQPPQRQSNTCRTSGCLRTSQRGGRCWRHRNEA